jgi:hypothetical protein
MRFSFTFFFSVVAVAIVNLSQLNSKDAFVLESCAWIQAAPETRSYDVRYANGSTTQNRHKTRSSRIARGSQLLVEFHTACEELTFVTSR